MTFLSRQFATSTLLNTMIVCMVLCCSVCRLGAAPAAHGATVSATAPSCCSQPHGSEQQPGDSEESAPDDCNGICCIKGTGAKDIGANDDLLAATPLVAALPMQTIVLAYPSPQVRGDHVRSKPPAPTLLRQRCALIL